MNPEIVIIGGGISGLHTAFELQKLGKNFILLEARERLGGRILSKNYGSKISSTDSLYDAEKPAYDLGPSWFWPGQINIETLLNELNLTDAIFPQQAEGESIYEDQQGNIQRGFYGISMEGAYRLKGGIRQIITNLEKHINPENILRNSQVKCVEYIDNQLITTVVQNGKQQKQINTISSEKIVIALPPRLAISGITFKPSLEKSRMNELNSYATWMAGHAKIIVVYEKPFWLEQGLSGDVVSQLGPMREIHDASAHNNSDNENGFALFGFVGVPGSYRKDNEEEISKAAVDQLVRLFGEDAASPIEIVLQDWAQEALTATEVDQSMSGGHATSSMHIFTEPGFDNRLIWSGTETAGHIQGTNGLLEGALEASNRTLKLLS